MARALAVEQRLHVGVHREAVEGFLNLDARICGLVLGEHLVALALDGLGFKKSKAGAGKLKGKVDPSDRERTLGGSAILSRDCIRVVSNLGEVAPGSLALALSCYLSGSALVSHLPLLRILLAYRVSYR